jgi:hypothetical protein
MATSMFQGSGQVSVVLAESEGSLRSIIFASREGLAIAHKVDDAYPQQVVKLTINRDAIAPGDFVVRSVIAGTRCKIELLAMDENGDGFQRLLEMLSQQQLSFECHTAIEFAEGTALVELPNAVVIAAYKGR